VISVEAAPPPPEPEVVPAPPAAGTRRRLRRPARRRGIRRGRRGFDPGTDVLMGSIDAIEVNGGNSSVLDETAILFANRQDQAAESGLRAALVAESLGR
jgi:hypothetical protein